MHRILIFLVLRIVNQLLEYLIKNYTNFDKLRYLDNYLTNDKLILQSNYIIGKKNLEYFSVFQDIFQLIHFNHLHFAHFIIITKLILIY